MFRIVWTLSSVVLFLAACGGGGSDGGGGSEIGSEIQSRAEALIQADPAFLGSEVLILHDGGSERAGKVTCDVNECEIEDQETSLSELLFAEGFEHTETRRGVILGRGRLQHFEGEILRYGGWLDHSVFAVHSGILTDGQPETPGSVMENIIHSYSVGVPAGTNPVSGSASWTGVMVGADRSPTDRRDATVGNFIRGDATLTVDFAQTNVDVVFDNIMDLETERVLLDMEWTDIPMTDGAFETGTIQGRFYGEDHEEVGGIFERDLILGAFGAKR